jgi:hypothetical protein
LDCSWTHWKPWLAQHQLDPGNRCSSEDSDDSMTVENVGTCRRDVDEPGGHGGF